MGENASRKAEKKSSNLDVEFKSKKAAGSRFQQFLQKIFKGIQEKVPRRKIAGNYSKQEKPLVLIQGKNDEKYYNYKRCFSAW